MAYDARRSRRNAADATRGAGTPARPTVCAATALNTARHPQGRVAPARVNAVPGWMRWIAGWALLVLPGYLLYALYIGMSLPIDYFIYHDYAALQMGQHRLAQDLFPASIQTYLNPTGFGLLEAMLRAQWPSWWISLAFATLHSLNGLFVFLVCHALAQGRTPGARRVLWVGGFIGATGPMLLSVVGTTFLDPLTSVPLLAALWLLMRPATRLRGVLLAAFLAGAGTGLKLSNLPFALALAVLVVLHGGGGMKAMALRAGSGALAMWAGVLATHGWWSWQLWQRFGNPMFPLFNGVFESPWAPLDSLVWPRFAPHDLLDALAFPFRMALPVPWVYSEAIAPDLFPGAVVVLALAAGGVALWRRRRGAPALPAATVVDGGAERLFWIYMACAWLVWLATSGNGRYALPLLLLTGVATALLALRALDEKRALAVCVLLALLQTGNLSIASAVRWSSGQWTRHWITMDVPARLRAEPMLYLSADGVVKSALARQVHPDSVFVQLVGATYSVPGDGATGAWVREAIARHPGRIRAVFAAPPEVKDHAAGFAAYIDMLGRTLDRIGLAVDASDCERIPVNGQPAAGPNFNKRLARPAKENLWTCGAHAITPSPRMAMDRARADRTFADLEARCPKLYRPAGVQTEGDGRIWTRVYPMHDALIVTVNQGDGVVSQRLFGQGARQQVGALGTWAADVARYDCSLPLGGIRGAPSLAHLNFKKPAK